MVELMLHYSCKISFYPFVMFLKFLVKICYPNLSRTCHFLMNTRHAKTPLLHRFCLAVISFNYMRIYKCLFVPFVFRQVVRYYVKVYDDNPYVFAYLWCCKTYAF